jgi:hypothetical protein
MTPGTFNRNNSKWPEVKILFILDLFLTNSNRILLNIPIISAVLGVFSIKKLKLPPLWWCFVYSGRLVVINDFQAITRSVAEGRGQSLGVLPASYWSPGSLYVTLSRMAMHFFL